jgi:hypothetical protein
VTVNSSRLATSVSYLFLIFVGIYFFELASFPISIDEEIAAFRTDASVWVLQGRWGAYLFEALVLPQSSIPVVPPVIFGAGCVLSYVLLLDTIRGHRELKGPDFLNFAIFCGYPTWVFLVEFYSNIAAVGLGLLLSTLCVRVMLGTKNVFRLSTRVAVAVVCGALGIAMYQSFLFVIAAMGIGVALIRSVEGRPNETWGAMLLLSVVTVGAVLLYKLGDIGFRWAYPTIDPYFNSLLRLDQLASEPGATMRRTIAVIGGVYGVGSSVFGAPMWATLVTLVSVARHVGSEDADLAVRPSCSASIFRSNLEGRPPSQEIARTLPLMSPVTPVPKARFRH